MDSTSPMDKMSNDKVLELKTAVCLFKSGPDTKPAATAEHRSTYTTIVAWLSGEDVGLWLADCP